jgi:pimeloyl-ACP methyl ester carboxylesterase
MPYIDSRAGKVSYEECGSGPPLILVAGFGQDTSAWLEQRDIYARFFRVLMLDLRGSGSSDVPEPGYDPADLADDVIILMDTLGLKKAHFGGFSLGGAVGMELAIRNPERLISLSIHSSWEATEPYPHFRQWIDIRRRIIALNDPIVNVGTRLVSFFSPDFINSRQDRIELFIKRANENPRPITPKAIDGQAEACMRHDVRGRLEAIRVPTLITVGTKDRTTPPSASEYLHRNIRGSEYVTLEGGAHCTMFQMPEEFASVSLGFLMKHAHAT